MQAHPESLIHQAIVGAAQEDPSTSMEHIQSLIKQYQLAVSETITGKVSDILLECINLHRLATVPSHLYEEGLRSWKRRVNQESCIKRIIFP